MWSNLLLLLLGLTWGVDARLVEVHIITRHGSRSHSSSASMDEGANSFLTELGVHQCRNQGQWIKQAYFGNHTRFSDVTVFSSDTERTLYCAQAMGEAMFDHRDALIHTSKKVHDLQLQAHANCPNIDSVLEEWYASSEEVKGMREAKASLMQSIEDESTKSPPGSSLQSWHNEATLPLTLENFQQFYDAYHVQRTERPDTIPSTLSAYEEEINNLATWLETRKFGYGVSRNYASLHFMQSILKTLQEATTTPTDAHAKETNPRIVLYSGHYPLLLSLFSQMELEVTRIPEYASLLAFELHYEEEQYFVKVTFKDGTSAEPVMMLPDAMIRRYTDSGPYGTSEDGKGVEFTTFFAAATLRQLSFRGNNWCDFCGNEEADVCLAASAESLRRENSKLGTDLSASKASLEEANSQLIALEAGGDNQKEIEDSGWMNSFIQFLLAVLFGIMIDAFCLRPGSPGRRVCLARRGKGAQRFRPVPPSLPPPSSTQLEV